MQEEVNYAALLEIWQQLAASYQSRANDTTGDEAIQAQEQADRFVRLATSMDTLMTAGTFTLDGPRRQHEIPRPEAGIHKQCPSCQLVKHARHYGTKINRPDGLKLICKECERESRLALKNEGK